MNKWLADWTKRAYPDSKRDLCTCFIERGFDMLTVFGYSAMVTMESWMFLSSFEAMRRGILENHRIAAMVYMNRMVMRIAFNTCATVFANHRSDELGLYTRVEYQDLNEEGIPFEFPVKRHAPKRKEGALEALANPGCGWFYRADADRFGAIPGSPIAYWVSPAFVDAFTTAHSVGDISDFTGSRNKTGDNARFVRFIWEISLSRIGGERRWIPYSKGGDFRRWFGNADYVVDWGDTARIFYSNNQTSSLLAKEYWYREGIAYNAITSGKPHFRYLPRGYVFDMGGPVICGLNGNLLSSLAFFNSSVCEYYLAAMNPTLNLQGRDIKTLPLLSLGQNNENVDRTVAKNLNLAKADWDSFETSRDFKRHPLV